MIRILSKYNASKVSQVFVADRDSRFNKLAVKFWLKKDMKLDVKEGEETG